MRATPDQSKKVAHRRTTNAVDRVVRAEFQRIVAPTRIVVDNDNARRAQRTQILHCKTSEPTGTDHDRDTSRHQFWQHSLDCVV